MPAWKPVHSVRDRVPAWGSRGVPTRHGRTIGTARRLGAVAVAVLAVGSALAFTSMRLVGAGSAYTTAVLADSPSWYFRLDEASGTTMASQVNTPANNGTYAGPVTYGAASLVASDPDAAMGFNGTSTNAYTNTAAAALTTSWTQEAWFKTTSVTGGVILGWDSSQNDTSSTEDHNILMQANGDVFASVCSPYTSNASLCGQTYVTTSTAYNDGKAHLADMVVTKTGTNTGTLALYIDGALAAASSAGGNPAAIGPTGSLSGFYGNILCCGSTNSGYWRVGDANISGWTSYDGNLSNNFFNGTIDEVAIYPAALTAARVLAHYQAAAVVTPTVTMTATRPSSTYGTPNFFYATITPTVPMPTGTVTFKDGATTIGTATVDATGHALFGSATLAAGSHSITANYGGDSNYAAASSSATPVTVTANSTGPLWMWGSNDCGELGNGSSVGACSGTGAVLAPTQIPLANVIAGSNGDYGSAVLTSSENVWVTGDNFSGELGNGTASCGTDPCVGSTTFVEVTKGGCTACTGTFLDHIIKISYGDKTMFALRDDGTVFAWGSNVDGQIGDNTTTNALTPVDVLSGGASGVCGANLCGVVDLSTTGHSPMALRSDGTVYSWGYNNYGQWGNGVTGGALGTATTPVQVRNPANTAALTGIVSIFAGGGTDYALGIATNEYAWGRGDVGQLGNGTTTAANNLPVQTIASGVAMIGGGGFGGMAITAGGALEAWGGNDSGQLGNGTASCGAAPCLGSATPVAVTGLGSGVVAMGGDYESSYAMTSSGAVYSWGANNVGELGTGTTTPRTTPGLVLGASTGMLTVWGGRIATAGGALGYLSPTVTVTSSMNPFTLGTSANITYTATLGGGTPAPTGTLNFEANGTTITGCGAVAVGTGTCTTTAPSSAGSVAITVIYSGDTNYASATGSMTQYAGKWNLVPPDAATPASSFFYAVTCVTANDCWAVGYQGTSTSQTLTEHWNGTTWSVKPSYNLSTTLSNILQGVTCTSSNNCIAVGYEQSSSTTSLALIEQWNGTAWVGMTAAQPGSTFDNLSAVACASATECYAAGYEKGSKEGGLIEYYNGTSWTAATFAASGTATINLYGIGCMAPGNCVAAGVNGGSNYALSGATTVWSATPNLVTVVAGSEQFTGLSCTSDRCIASGYTSASPFQIYGEWWDGTRWWKISGPSGTSTVDNNGVACVSDTACRTVGSDGGTNIYTWVYAGSSLTADTPTQPGGVPALLGTACAAINDCWGVGYYTPGTSQQPLIEHFTTTASGPSVTSVSPTSGPAAGGTSVVITGSGFTGATAVSFGATSAPGFTVNSDTQITVTSPAGSAGTVDVKVTTGSGTSPATAADHFIYQAATTTTVVSSVNPSVLTENVNLTATVAGSSPTGTVTFKDGATTLGTVAVGGSFTATFVTGTLTVGGHSITAVYSGDANNTASTSATLTQTVNAGPSATTVTSSANPSVAGQAVTYTVNVAGNTPATVQDKGFWVAAGTVGASQAYAYPSAITAGNLLVGKFYTYGTGNTITGVSDNLNGAWTKVSGAEVVDNGDLTTWYVADSKPGAVTVTVTYNIPCACDSAWSHIAEVSGVVATNPVDQVITNDKTALTTSASVSTTSAQVAGEYAWGGVVWYNATSTQTTISNGSPAFTLSLDDGNADAGAGYGAVSWENRTVAGVNTVTWNSTVSEAAVASLVTFKAVATPVATGTVTFKDGATTICTTTLTSGSATCNQTYASIGSHSITVAYGGDTNYTASTSAALTQTVNQGQVYITISPSVNPALVGQAVTYTVNVSAQAPATGQPTGPVTVYDNGTAISGCSNIATSGGVATCTWTYTAVGSHTVYANGGGDANYNGASTPTFTETINQAATTTGLVSTNNPSVFGQSVTFTATVSATAPATGTPTGTVTFKDGVATLGTGALAGGTATYSTTALAIGTHSITAVYGGDTNYATSTSGALSQVVNKAATTTGLASSANPSVVGQAVTYTATISVTAPGSGTPTGTVTFKDGATVVCNAVSLTGTTATCAQTYTTTAGSPHSITAVYAGDTNFNTSTSGALSQVVNQASTTTGVASSVNPSVVGQAVTYTATVSVTAPGSGTPTGTVTFKDGATVICSAVALTGTTATCAQTYTATAGSPHSITAVYSGDTNFTTSTSSALSQVVNQASTTTGVASSVNPSVVGQAVTYTATVSVTAPGSGTPTGTVTFKDGATVICSAVALTGTTATCAQTYATTAGSPHSITAVYSGDTNFTTSTSSALSQTVNTAATTTALASGTNPSTYGQTVTFTATVSVTAPGTGTVANGDTVTFKNGATVLGTGTTTAGVATYTTTAAQLTGGSDSITAVFAGDAGYATSTSAALTQTVNKTAPTVTVAASVNPSAYGQEVTFTVTTGGAGAAPTGTVTLFDGATAIGGPYTLDSAGVARAAFSTLAVGAHTITAQYAGDGNYTSLTSAALTQTVNKASTTTSTPTSSANPSSSGQSVTFQSTTTPLQTAQSAAAPAPSGATTLPSGALFGNRFHVGAPGQTVQSVTLTFNAVSASPNNHIQVAFYTDSAGVPGTLVASSAATTVAVGAVAIPINATLNANTAYWVLFNVDGAGDQAQSSGDTFSATVAYQAASAYGTWPGVAPAPATQSATTLTLQIGYLTPFSAGATAGFQTAFSGTDNGNNVMELTPISSGPYGMTVSSVRAYFINADVSPNNQWQAAIYTDAGGAPGALLATSAPGTITVSAWNTLAISATLGTNQHYWVAIEANATSVALDQIATDTTTALQQYAFVAAAFGTWPQDAPTGETYSQVAKSVYVSGAAAFGPTGTTSFKNGATAFASGSVGAGGVASAAYSGLPVGSDSVTAVYGGDTHYVTSTSGTLTQVVNGSLSVGAPGGLNLGSLTPGSSVGPSPLGSLTVTNTLADGLAWNVQMSASDLYDSGSSTLGVKFTAFTIGVDQAPTPVGTVSGTVTPGSASQPLSGTDTPPGTTQSTAITLLTGTSASQGTWTMNNSLSLIVPGNIPNGHTYTSLVTYTITG